MGGRVALARQSALLPGDGVVQVAPGGGPAAAGGGAPGVTHLDQVLECAAGPVAGFGVVVAAGAARDRGHRDAQGGRSSPAGRYRVAGRGPAVAVRSPVPGGGCRPAAQPWAAAVPSGCSAVTHHRVRGSRAAAAARSRASAASASPNPATLGQGAGRAGQRRPRHRDVHQRGEARPSVPGPGWRPGPLPPGPLAGPRLGPPWSPGPLPPSFPSGPAPGSSSELGSSGRVRRARAAAGACVRIGRDAAAVAFLKTGRGVGLDAEFLQGAGDAGGAQVQGALLDVLPRGEDLIGREFAGDHPRVAGVFPEPAHVRVLPGGLLAPLPRIRGPAPGPAGARRRAASRTSAIPRPRPARHRPWPRPPPTTPGSRPR